MDKFTCADCGIKACYSHETEKFPKTCPSRETSTAGVSHYTQGELKIAHEAALVEATGYCKDSRLEETMSFAYRMNYRKIGVAFCVGLKKEAKILVDILRDNGFEVDAIMCKNGSIPKCEIGITDEQQVRPGRCEIMCNPIAQAEYLKEKGTEFNILFGLCVGHDTLFFKHSETPVTVLVCKDRALGHNPIGAIYQSEYYMKYVHTYIKDHFGDRAGEDGNNNG